jgi:hypothetical protein
MLKIFIVLYMTLFTSFDMVVERLIELKDSNSSIELEHQHPDALSGSQMSHTSEHKDCADSDNCKDCSDCTDCHECHLGHCGFIINPSVKIKNLSIKCSTALANEPLVTRYLTALFRPPIKA